MAFLAAVNNAKGIAKKHWRRRDKEITADEMKSIYYQAVTEIKRNGFTATLNNEKFQDIVDLKKHPELDYNPNNFLGIDHPLRNMMENPLTRKLISTESTPFLARAIKLLESGVPAALGISLKFNKNQQVEMNNYVNAVEASRKFEGDAMKIIYLQFANLDGSGVNYGPANRPLAIKRILKYRGYLMSNLNEKVASAEQLIPYLPVLLKSFRKEICAANMLETVSSLDVGAFDIYEIQRWLKRVKSVSKIKSLCEGGVDDNMQRTFGLFEKPFSTITKLWPLKNKPSEHSLTYAQIRDEAISAILGSMGKTIEPIFAGVFALMDDDRGAAGAGGAKSETTEFGREFFDWMMSDDGGRIVEKNGKQVVEPLPGWKPRELGGMPRYNSLLNLEIHDQRGSRPSLIVEDLFKQAISFLKADYNNSTKMWEEVLRRLNQGH
jgi:hypothetical protein